MKYLPLLGLIFLITAGCTKKTTGWDFKNLKAQPHSVTTLPYQCKLQNGKWIQQGNDVFDIISEIKFNNEGNIVEEKYYDNEYSIYDYTYEYVDKRIMKRNMYDHLQKKMTTEEVFNVSEPNFKVSSVTTNDLIKNDLIRTNKYEWDNNSIIRTAFTEQGNTSITEYQYDQNHILKKMILFEEMKPEESTIFEYVDFNFDDRGNWISRVTINPYNDQFGIMEKRTIVY